MNTKVNNLLERYKGIVFFFDTGKASQHSEFLG